MNEALDMTYRVRYFSAHPLIPPSTDGLSKMDYTQAVKVASGWIKDDRETDILDDLLPVLHIGPRGVEFVQFEPSHAHFLEHLKMKIELDKTWGERMQKRFQI